MRRAWRALEMRSPAARAPVLVLLRVPTRWVLILVVMLPPVTLRPVIPPMLLVANPARRSR